ncbi:hypothetical protein SAMN06264364_10866 [Quadrisphaera granulorum]|uniref:CBU-0592-like domain-containing protein n=1 Tax=Quadrisphaera granulorum TaxID=317664 RepID=A0A316A9S6_9ACTN|nr:hypothetical protein [Quadrisphaera granulorum]PWJ54159.1 hypothetical protein BXY45_10866 [Quadrisphaera granulorum]SZE96298.1 hypothetical protein SAMN06264364_10866 [Quadrisphaera granulorum]
MSISDIANVLGLVGVSLVVTTYYLLQSGRLQVQHLRYSATNAVASVLVLFSLAFHWNLSSAVIEGFWLLISLYGCAQWWRARRAGGASTAG